MWPTTHTGKQKLTEECAKNMQYTYMQGRCNGPQKIEKVN